MHNLAWRNNCCSVSLIGNDGAECINRSGIAGIGRGNIGGLRNNIEAVTELLKLPQMFCRCLGCALAGLRIIQILSAFTVLHFGA